MYFKKEIIFEKLNISETTLLTYRASGDIRYSDKTDKYDMDSVLQSRTMTVGIDKYYSREEKEQLISDMEDYSKLKHTLFSKLQKGIKFPSNGTNRPHRALTKEINPSFTNLIADTALAVSQGLVKSSQTWKEKYEKELKSKIKSLEKSLKEKELKSKIKPSKSLSKTIHKIKRGLVYKKKALKGSLSKDYKSVWFGGSHLKGDIKDKEQYLNSRLEYFISGTAGIGNHKIRIQRDKEDRYELLILGKKIPNIKIPSTHKSTFTLNEFNRQSSRISFNKKGKLVLNITYSYIKPMKLSHQTKSLGTIGIDIGPKEIAVCYVKNDGNPLKYEHYNIAHLLDSRNEEKQRILSEILEKITNKAIEEKFYHITIENLDKLNFKKTYNKELNRMLSKFPKTIFEELISSKCARKGIKIKKINPAFTSIIGLFKYSYRDNLSTSHSSKSKDLSAALVIGRRGLGFKESKVVCVRVFGEIFSMKIKNLMSESEKELINFNNHKYFNNYLWKYIQQRFKNVETLTEYIHVHLYTKGEILRPLRFVCDNEYNTSNNSHSRVVEDKPF